MKPASYIIAGCLLLAMPTFANAVVDGHELLEKCEPIEKLYNDPASLSSKEGSGVVYCMGYTDSFIETFYFQVKAKIVPSVPFCMSEEDLARKDIIKVVVDYLKNHSDELAKPAGYHLFMALRQAYPCSQKEKEEAVENKSETGL
jgi:hypothetical protein